jgi:cell division initiation protein
VHSTMAAMDISAKTLREVEFGGQLRGYDTDEVDEFLENVALAVDELHRRIAELAERAERAERALAGAEQAPPSGSREDEEVLRRTLVLAQRAADLAVSEAEAEARTIIERGRDEADRLVGEAHAMVDRLTTDAERARREEVARLAEERERLHSEVASLVSLLEGERSRLEKGLRSALRWVERSMTPSSKMVAARSAHSELSSSSRHAAPDRLEADIAEDAAAAAPSRGSARAGRANLAGVPVITDGDLTATLSSPWSDRAIREDGDHTRPEPAEEPPPAGVWRIDEPSGEGQPAS